MLNDLKEEEQENQPRSVSPKRTSSKRRKERIEGMKQRLAKTKAIDEEKKWVNELRDFIES